MSDFQINKLFRSFILLSLILTSWGVFCIFSLLIRQHTAKAAVFIVSNNNADGSGSLSQAIEEANNTVGTDIIQVNTSGPIFINDTLNITESVVITGQNVIVDGSNLSGISPCFAFSGDSIELSEFTIQNCPGSGITIDQGEGNIISDNTITNNALGGISLTSQLVSQTTINNNIIRHNSSSGIGLKGSSSNIISNNNISGNLGPGIIITGLTAIANQLSQNLFTDQDLAISLDNGANEGLDIPIISTADVTAEKLEITGTAPEQQGTVEFFINSDDNNLAEQYLGEAVVREGYFEKTFSGDYTSYVTITATFTDNDNNTSEFASKEISLIPVTDNTAPTLTNLNVEASYVSATLTWQTDEPATSVVEYGKTKNLGNTKTNNNLVTDHSIILSALEAGKQYYYRIKSTDASNNQSISKIKTFTTKEYAPISSPQEGAVIYNNQVTFTGADEQIKKAKISLFIDNNIQNKNTKADNNGEYSLRSNQLTYDGHAGRIKATKNKQKIKSQTVNFTTASSQTTDRFQIYAQKSDRKKSEANVTNTQRPIFFGNAPQGVIRLFIDGLEAAKTKSLVLDYQIKPDNNLSYGKHTAQIKVYKNKRQIWSSAPYDFIVYQPYPIASFGEIVDNRYLIFLVPDSAYYQVFIDKTNIKEDTAPNTGTGTASISVDLASYQDGQEHQVEIRTAAQQRMPYSTAITQIKLDKPIVATPISTPTPTSPTEETADQDNSEDIISGNVKEVILDTSQDSQLQTTDREEDIMLKDIQQKQEQLKEEAKKTATRKTAPVYSPITKAEIPLTAQEVKEVKELLEKNIPQTKINITLDEASLPYQITDQGIQVTVPKEVGITQLWNRIIGREEKKVAGNLEFQGTIESIDKLKNVRGYAIITLFSDPIIRIAQSDEDGQWKISVPLEALPAGEHTAYLGTEINGVQSDQLEIARIIIKEEEKLSSTTIFFIVNIIIAISVLLVAIYLQLRKNKPPSQPLQKSSIQT